MDSTKELRREVTYTQWPNYVKLKEYLTESIDTGEDDDRDAEWQWEIDDVWIRLS